MASDSILQTPFISHLGPAALSAALHCSGHCYPYRLWAPSSPSSSLQVVCIEGRGKKTAPDSLFICFPLSAVGMQLFWPQDTLLLLEQRQSSLSAKTISLEFYAVMHPHGVLCCNASPWVSPWQQRKKSSLVQSVVQPPRTTSAVCRSV